MRFRHRSFHFAALAAALLVSAGAGPARAQAPAGPITPPPGSVAKQAPPEKQIRVKVELVSTPVTVRDRSGELMLNLDERDFRIFDNGVEQKIEHFDLGGDPLSVVILLETSSRVEPLLPAVRRTGILFSQAVMAQTGEAAVIAFDDTPEVQQPFTRNGDQVEAVVTKLRTGTSGAALYDALAKAVGLLEDRPKERRRVIIALAEAVDTGSESKLGEVLREAQLNNITVYSVGLSTTAAEFRGRPKDPPPSPFPPGTLPRPGIPGTPQTPTTEQQRTGSIDFLALAIWLVQHASQAVKENSLEIAAAATGGRHMATFRDRSIERALDQIAGELHAQYALAYRPAGAPASGFHNIRVEVARPGVSVHARPGYYLPPPEG